MSAVYRYKHLVAGQLVDFTAKVEVVGASNNRLLIKLREFHADGRAPGAVLWVAKRKVRTTYEMIPRNIRLPYKDND